MIKNKPGYNVCTVRSLYNGLGELLADGYGDAVIRAYNFCDNDSDGDCEYFAIIGLGTTKIDNKEYSEHASILLSARSIDDDDKVECLNENENEE